MRIHLGLGALLVCAGACGSASVRVELDALEAQARGPLTEEGVRPSVFGMTLVSIHIVEDIADDLSNQGAGSTIWMHPACQGEWDCGIDPARPQVVSDYFDFAAPSAQVNAALNSQAATIGPGTYRYVRFDFTGPGGSDEPSMRFGDERHVTLDRFRNDLNMVPIDPPLEISAGESVVLTVQYDLARSYFVGPQDPTAPPEGGDMARWYCGETPPGAQFVDGCFYFDLFRPAFAETIAAN